MKHLLLALSIASFAATNAKAQNKIHFMMVSIHAGYNAHQPEIVVTKENGAQEITKAGKKSWMSATMTFDEIRDGRIAENEDSLFLTLKPYFDAGWQLSASTIIRNGESDDYIARYYFTKKDD